MTKESILVIEDEDGLRDLIKVILRKRNYSVSEAGTATAAYRQLKRRKFDLILLDLTLPDGSGLEILERIAVAYRNRVIIVSGTGTIATAVEAMRKGAFDFLKKPVDADVLQVTVNKAIEVNQDLDDYRTLKDKFEELRIEKIVCHSPEMEDVLKKARESALSGKTVLITGETGTGKELVARAIHNDSDRRGSPFITVNCAAIPISLAESELFGFEKGAFTGAEKPYPGKFFLADKGTIFLDEIGELHPEIQPKLLRVLESGEIFPLNGTRAKNLDIRVIAATNKDLDKDDDLDFRSDLYYRIQQVEILIPPLRKRKLDIIPLVNHFIAHSNLAHSKRVTQIDDEVKKLLLGYRWPGNVRELKNTIEEIMAFISVSKIKVEHLPTRLLKYQDPGNTGEAVLPLQDLEKNHIKRVLKITGNNIKKTANLLGIGRPALYRKIEKYNIKKK
ncbi:MAG: sigma-54-dependent Fis family transcriptional regulator [bacterium]|nr:sigma-54-dependent Fis family transcriptional regulator [bacterium]